MERGFTAQSRFPLLLFKLYGFIAQQYLDDLLEGNLPFKKLVKEPIVKPTTFVYQIGELSNDWTRECPVLSAYSRTPSFCCSELVKTKWTTAVFKRQFEMERSALQIIGDAPQGGTVSTGTKGKPLSKEQSTLLGHIFKAHPLFGFRTFVQLTGILMANTMMTEIQHYVPQATKTGCVENTMTLLRAATFFNHSCEPKTVYMADTRVPTALWEVHAATRLSKGEEIHISYVSKSSDRETRQHVLQVQYGFQCTCPRCTRK